MLRSGLIAADLRLAWQTSTRDRTRPSPIRNNIKISPIPLMIPMDKHTLLLPKSLAALAAVLIATTTFGLAGVKTARLSRETLDRDVQKIVADHAGPIRVGLWAGGATGDA